MCLAMKHNVLPFRCFLIGLIRLQITNWSSHRNEWGIFVDVENGKMVLRVDEESEHLLQSLGFLGLIQSSRFTFSVF